jgi:hypothetical protein
MKTQPNENPTQSDNTAEHARLNSKTKAANRKEMFDNKITLLADAYQHDEYIV